MKWKIFSGLLLIAFIGVGIFYGLLQPKSIDQNGCRTDGVVVQHRIVLIDQSDPFTVQDVEWVQRLLKEESRNLDRYGAFTVLGLRSDNPYEPVEVFSMCSPGAMSNGWTDNPKMIAGRFDKLFAIPLQDAVVELLAETSQPSSPLIEALIGISDRADFSEQVAKRRIIMISDLIQNSENLSHYNSGLAFETVEQTRFASEKPKLEGIDILVRIVPRRSYDLPKAKLIEFWRTMFEVTNAESFTIE